MTWQQDFYNKFVHSEYNPSQDNYGEAYLDGDPFELETFITSLLKKQRESCFQSLIQAKLPEGTMSFPEWNYSKMNQMQVRDYILNAPDE